MIRPEDFQIQITDTNGGAGVQVVHLPTGNQRTADNVEAGTVGKVRDQLIRQLRAELYRDEDIRVDTILTSRGEVVRVTHTPTGTTRMSLRSDLASNQAGDGVEFLLDEILEELHPA